MTWLKVDDGFHSHPKILAVSLAARGMWVTGGSYAADNLTDGFIPTVVVRMHGGLKAAKELVAAELWLPADGGYQVHDWLSYNPSRDEEATKAEDRRKRARKAADARWNRGA